MTSQRDTRQRRAIRRVFLTTGRPLTPEEVLLMGQRTVNSLGLATVYRNIKILNEEGWLSEVDLPGGGTRYELAERPHHHHFLCRSCDQAYDVDGCPDNIDELAPPGFAVERHELTLFGLCGTCS